jgi:uncharacterized membrane protein
MTEENRPDEGVGQLTEGLPTQRLAQEAKNLLEMFAQRALASVGAKVSEKVGEATHGLLDKVGGQDGGGPGVKAAVSGLTALTEGKGPFRAALGAGATGLKEKVKQLFKGGKGGKRHLKFTTIIETLDVGVPLRLAYDQWTQYEEFPTFMKKVENVDRPSEEKANWKAQVFWSHRVWESTILEQVPDDHIVWRSKGAKGYVDGAVSFSELAPNLTRICLVMEYHPQGLFERTGNIWRAQGRRARLEFKHFRRHMMAHAILKPDEIEGWRGEIRDSEVVKTHEEALEEEQRARGEEPEEEPGAAPEDREPGEEERAEGPEDEEERAGEEGPEDEEGPEEEEGHEEVEGHEEEEGHEEDTEDAGPAEEDAEGGGEEPEEAPEPPRDEEPEKRPRARRPAGDEDEDRPRRPPRRRPAEEDRPARPARRRPRDEEDRPARPPRRRPAPEPEPESESEADR